MPSCGRGVAARRRSGRLSGLIRGADLLVYMTFLAALAAADGLRSGLVRGRELVRVWPDIFSRAIGSPDAILPEWIGLTAQCGFNLAPKGAASPNAHSVGSGGLGLRHPVRVRRIPSSPGGPS